MPPSPPSQFQILPIDVNLPIVKHFLRLAVENKKIVIDISDETGGLGLRMFFDRGKALEIGNRLIELANLANGEI